MIELNILYIDLNCDSWYTFSTFKFEDIIHYYDAIRWLSDSNFSQLIDFFMKDLSSDNDRSAISDILGRIVQMGNLWRFRIAVSPGCWTCRVIDFAHCKTSRCALFQRECQNTGENVWIWLGCDGGGIFSRVASYWTGLVSEVPCA